MRFAEILREDTNTLYLVLRQLQGEADSEGMPMVLHFDKNYTPVQGALNKNIDELMTNAGSVQFTYDTFNDAYEQDSRIKDLVKQFDSEKIELKTEKEMVDPASQADQQKDTVGDMASRAAQKGLDNELS